MSEQENYEELSGNLIAWFELNKREMPWRLTKDPYSIWLSEIILQQTQVVQGTPYFKKFIVEFPTLKDLAASSEEKVLKLWQGLGYYSRARNMFETAKFIYFDLEGQFPDSYHKLLKLKGVGDYTAAAIASIAYNEPVAVVDGNVIRVIARIFKIKDAYDSGKGKRLITDLANLILNRKNPATHNQAMMELGSLICRPQNPTCNVCPLKAFCLANHDNTVLNYPVKSKKLKSRHRYFNFIVPILSKDKTILTQRTSSDIWKNMFTFPLIETERELSYDEFIPLLLDEYKGCSLLKVSKINHILSHQVLNATFFLIAIKENRQFKKNNIFEVEIKSLKEFYSLPRLITKYMESKDVSSFFNI
ncbi:MAG: A/G-specific adenine glycosylase [Bacteroidia bacterium]